VALRRASKKGRAKKKPARAAARKRKARPEPCDEPTDATRRSCGCLQTHFGLLDTYPEFRANQARIEQVTLGSDPQADETLRATADLVKELGAVATSAVAARSGCPTKNVETRESVRCVLPFAEWKANGYRCG
jgi:hypothetical protein